MGVSTVYGSLGMLGILQDIFWAAEYGNWVLLFVCQDMYVNFIAVTLWGNFVELLGVFQAT